EDRIDRERALALGLRPHARRRDARLLDPRERVQHSLRDGQLDGGPRGRDAREFHAKIDFGLWASQSLKPIQSPIVWRFVALLLALVAGVAAAIWYYRSPAFAPAARVERPTDRF